MSMLAQEMFAELTLEHFPFGTHACLLYDDELERRQLVAEFIKGGIDSGDRVVYFSDSLTSNQARKLFTHMGVIREDLHPDTFQFIDPVPCGYKSGTYGPRKLVDQLRAFCEATTKYDYFGTRICGEMSWSLTDSSGQSQLMTFETEIARLVEKTRACVICQYDFRSFGTKMIADVVRFHPIIIINGMIIQNPFFVEPDAFTHWA